MAGTFPVKRHKCECRHKGLKEGPGRVAMGSDRCNGMHIQKLNQKKADTVTDRAVGYNFGKGVWCEIV